MPVSASPLACQLCGAAVPALVSTPIDVGPARPESSGADPWRKSVCVDRLPANPVVIVLIDEAPMLPVAPITVANHNLARPSRPLIARASTSSMSEKHKNFNDLRVYLVHCGPLP
jgi:hypothetical protein